MKVWAWACGRSAGHAARCTHFSEAAVARAAAVAEDDPLRDGPLDPRPATVHLFECVGMLPLARRHERLLLSPGADHH